MAATHTRSSRGVDRLINFTDAVSAVAITLLALPLVDLRPEGDQTFADVARANIPQIIACLVTFFLVGVLWLAHNRVLNGIVGYDGALFWLNMLWLATIALLPWLSSQLGDNGWTTDGVDPSIGVAFWSAMAVATFSTAAMWRYLQRHPDLLEPEVAARPPLRWPGRHRGTILGAFFVLLAVLSAVAPAVAHWAPLLIIPLSAVLRTDE